MYIVAALYHFTRFEDPASLVEPLLTVCQEANIAGTLLLASEGVNGTISGTRDGIDRILSHLRSIPGCEELEHKESTATELPFRRMKVKLKKEIVTMGQPDVDPLARKGRYVAPEDWNELIESDDVVLIDTRNDYEVGIGTFKGAINPETKTFREFPKWWKDNQEQFRNKKVAMFCTGGIRCEKSTNYLLGQGVEDVFHLQGGILKYLEEIPEEESQWEGDCFVFDARVSVGHGLKEGHHSLCHACRRPLTPQDEEHPDFVLGVSCHHCVHETSEEDKRRYRERQKQIRLSRARGEEHLLSLPNESESSRPRS
ncbi:MAG: rhodanese-related sulfurtransferase [Polyangiaceae bacterium]|nr:rhodanese-related sulfurtransferase [Polyangiaceae bacterium]